MVEVKQLVDNSGEFYPVTAAEAVIFANGENLEEKEFVTSEDVATAIEGALPRIYVGTCSTAAATAAKVATVEEFPLDSNNKPLVGTTIAVKFSATSSSTNTTLNVNNTGAASIYFNTGVNTTASSNCCGYANRHAFYVWDGTYWVWISHGTDNNDNTIGYQIRYNSGTKLMADATVRYRIFFSSADDSKWVPATTSTSTNATASRTVNQRPINPFGQIVYYGSTTARAIGDNPGSTVIFTQYNLTLGYSFNRTGAALVLTLNTPVYIKCAPQSDGSAIIDADTPYVQALPTTDDGKIYIYLGIASAATNVELSIVHPVYYYKNGALRIWTGVQGQIDAINSSLNTKQDVLVSGTNIKTVNGKSVLGSGNVSIKETLIVDIEDIESKTAATSVTSGTYQQISNALFNGKDVILRSYYLDEGYEEENYHYYFIKDFFPEDSYIVFCNNDINETYLVFVYGDDTVEYYPTRIQEKLVSGTNIKTINSTSLLGSGNISVQPTLVSGTNIKTINNTSLLGSGNITTSDTKNTAGSTDTSSKIFLIGATSQEANPQTYSDNEIYATSGVLTTKRVQVGGTAATIQYNSTDQSIEFIFA